VLQLSLAKKQVGLQVLLLFLSPRMGCRSGRHRMLALECREDRRIREVRTMKCHLSGDTNTDPTLATAPHQPKLPREKRIQGSMRIAHEQNVNLGFERREILYESFRM